MRRTLTAIGCAAILSLPFGLCPASQAAPRAAPAEETLPAQVSVCFVPAQACDTEIVAAIAGARHSIRVQAYGFTAQRILRALAAAHRRGVDVQAILDKSDDRAVAEHRRRVTHPGGAAFTAQAGIPTWIDDSVAIAHNKLIIIDGRLVIGGSYNYTQSAEKRNAENVTFIESPAVAALYLANWRSRQAVSHRLPEGDEPAYSEAEPAETRLRR